MEIKNLKPVKDSNYKQGYYPINECKKYFGKSPIIYRSSWEKKFCDYCEKNANVISWSSENVKIAYSDPKDNSDHYYHPDFFVTTANGLSLLIEVKPIKQTQMPIKPKNMTPKNIKRFNYDYEIYRINMLKFSAAKKYCDNRGWIFRIITEDFFLKLKGKTINRK